MYFLKPKSVQCPKKTQLKTKYPLFLNIYYRFHVFLKLKLLQQIKNTQQRNKLEFKSSESAGELVTQPNWRGGGTEFKR